MKETWKDIVGYKGLYQVSDLGRVKSLRRSIYDVYKKKYKSYPEVLLKPFYRRGYPSVVLSKRNKQKKYCIHKLVLLSFVGKSKLQVDHINCVKHDCRLNNLEYVTPMENMKRAIKNNLIARGEKSPKSKLTECEVKKIRKQYIKYNESTRIIGKRHGVSGATISCLLRNKTWSHVI